MDERLEWRCYVFLGRKLKEKRLNEIGYNKQGSKMKIIEYNDSTDIIVEFQDKYKYKVHTNYGNFKNGYVRNVYFPKEYGVGFIGEIDRKITDKDISYEKWHRMMARCYDKKVKRNESYKIKKCYVCDEWHCFKNFDDWFKKNYYEIKDETMCLDKDILIKGNNCYSPNTCCIVPNNINLLFGKSNKTRGKYLIGVSYNKSSSKFTSNININGKQKFLGYFETELEAFNTYKKEKEKNIKNMADKYRQYIPKKLYDAMYNYKVETTD